MYNIVRLYSTRDRRFINHSFEKLLKIKKKIDRVDTLNSRASDVVDELGRPAFLLFLPSSVPLMDSSRAGLELCERRPVRLFGTG